jgi:RNA recognition motif-containing protein
MEGLANVSLSKNKERVNLKQAKKPQGHSKAKSKQHDGSAKSSAVNPSKKKQLTNKPNDPQAVAEEAKRRIFIKNLHLKAKNSDLCKHFKQFGTLTRCGVLWDKMGKSRTVAIVEFETTAEAEKALKESKGVEVKGQAMEVAWAEALAK